MNHEFSGNKMNLMLEYESDKKKLTDLNSD